MVGRTSGGWLELAELASIRESGMEMSKVASIGGVERSGEVERSGGSAEREGEGKTRYSINHYEHDQKL